MKQSTFSNTRNWYCVKRTCFWISYYRSAVSNAVGISDTAMHMQELFCNISSSWQEDSLQSQSFRFVVSD